MVCIFENDGVCSLTKGRFSATAARGSKSKRRSGRCDQPVREIQRASGQDLPPRPRARAQRGLHADPHAIDSPFNALPGEDLCPEGASTGSMHPFAMSRTTPVGRPDGPGEPWQSRRNHADTLLRCAQQMCDLRSCMLKATSGSDARADERAVHRLDRRCERMLNGMSRSESGRSESAFILLLTEPPTPDASPSCHPAELWLAKRA